jgi:hypothetical protein
LDKVYQELLLIPKQLRKFKGYYKDLFTQGPSDPELGAKLFIESLGLYGDEFLQSYLYRSKKDIKEYDEKIAHVEPGVKMRTKGSVCQYLYFFSDDAYLNFWVGLIQQKIGNH